MFFESGSYVEKAFWMIGTNFEQHQRMKEWKRDSYGRGHIHMIHMVRVLTLKKTMPTLHTIANYKFPAIGSP